MDLTMWCVMSLLVVVAAVMSGAAGQHVRVSYDGTPLDDSSRVVFQGATSPGDSFPATLPYSPPFVIFPAPQQSTFTSPRIVNPEPTKFPSFGTCGGFSSPLVDECHGSQAYHFSWRHNSGWRQNSGREFTWYEAQDYCQQLGFTALSIEHETEDRFIASIITTYNIRAIWTSGRRVSYDNWEWASRSSSGYTNWSHTGRLGRHQPDNAEGDENCLSVGYNLYHDGVKWHDVRCSYRKVVICEAPRHTFLH